MKTKKKINIGILICGGCNPTYDRNEVLEFIKSELASYADFSYYDDTKEYPLVILINGCESECMIDNMKDPFVLITNDNKDEILTTILKKIQEIKK